MRRSIGTFGLVVLTAAACSSNTSSTPPASQPAPSASQNSASRATPVHEGRSGASEAATRPSHQAAEEPAARPNTSASSPEVAKPRFKDVVVPSGTTLSLKLQSSVASDTSKAEDKVRATLNKPIVVDGATAIPAGAQVSGTVLEAKESGRVQGRASIALRFDRLDAWKETYSIHTARIAREAESTKGDDAKKVGIGAGAGALVGALAGGKKGAAIGGLVGAGAGTGVVMATKGEEIRLAAGTVVNTTLADALKVTVPID